jgi:hypothetical protein
MVHVLWATWPPFGIFAIPHEQYSQFCSALESPPILFKNNIDMGRKPKAPVSGTAPCLSCILCAPKTGRICPVFAFLTEQECSVLSKAAHECSVPFS